MSALGAGPWAVRRSAIIPSLRAVCVAGLVGLPASWMALRLGETQRVLPLVQVAADPIPYIAVYGLLVALAVCTLGAIAYPVGLRAPMESLRAE